MKTLFTFLLLTFLSASGIAQRYARYVDSNGYEQINKLPIPISTAATFSQLNSATTNTVTPTTETTLLGSSYVGSKTLSLNSLVAGRLYEVDMFGFYSSPLLNLGSLVTKTYLGSTVIATLTLSNLIASASNLPFQSVLYIKVLSTGATGQIQTGGFITFNTSTITSITILYPMFTTTSIDLTAPAMTLNITGAYSNNTAGQSTTSSIVFIRPVY